MLIDPKSAVVVTSKFAKTPPTLSVARRVVERSEDDVRRTATATPGCTVALVPEATPLTRITGEPSPLTCAVMASVNPESVTSLESTAEASALFVAATNENDEGVKSPVLSASTVVFAPMRSLVFCNVLSVEGVTTVTRSLSPFTTTANPLVSTSLINTLGCPSPVASTEASAEHPETVNSATVTVLDSAAPRISGALKLPQLIFAAALARSDCKNEPSVEAGLATDGSILLHATTPKTAKQQAACAKLGRNLLATIVTGPPRSLTEPTNHPSTTGFGA